MKKRIYFLVMFICIFSMLNAYGGPNNSRGWVNIPQVMTAGTTSMTTAAFSAFNSISPFKYYSLGVSPSVGATWDVRLEGSNDQVGWSTILANSSVTVTTSAPVYQSNAQPCLYLRLRAASLTGSVTATAVGVP